jgi:hypothetical protein
VTLRCTVLPFYLHRALVSQCTISIHTHCALVNRSTTHHALPSRFCLLLCPQISLSSHNSTTSSLLHRALVSQCTILLTSLSPESLAMAQPNDFLFTTGFPVHDVKYTHTLLWLIGAQPHTSLAILLLCPQISLSSHSPAQRLPLYYIVHWFPSARFCFSSHSPAQPHYRNPLVYQRISLQISSLQLKSSRRLLVCQKTHFSILVNFLSIYFIHT